MDVCLELPVHQLMTTFMPLRPKRDLVNLQMGKLEHTY